MDGSINLWDPGNGRRLAAATVGSTPNDVELSDDGNWVSIFTATYQKVLDAATLGRKKSVTLALPPGNPPQFSNGPSGLSGDGSRVVAGAADGSIFIWDGRSGRLLHRLQSQPASPGAPPLQVVSAHVSNDGHTAIVLTFDSAVTVYNADTGQRGAVLRPDGSASDAIISPDGRTIATIGTNPAGVTGPAVFDAATGRRRFRTHAEYGIFAAFFSHNSRQVVTSGIDGTVAIWDVKSGGRRQLEGRPAGSADAAQFSNDDRQVAVAGSDGIGRVFDARSGQQLALLGNATQLLTGAQFGSVDGPAALTEQQPPNGSYATTRSYACDICGTTKHVQETAGRLLTRKLTAAETAQYVRGL
jgi:WD40 repeat protein